MKGGISERRSFSIKECLYLPVNRKVEEYCDRTDSPAIANY